MEINIFSHILQALDCIVKALTLCSPDDKTCAQMYVEHGDILRDLRDWQSAAEVLTLLFHQIDNKNFISILKIIIS